MTFDPTVGAPSEDPIIDPYVGASRDHTRSNEKKGRQRLMLFAAVTSLCSTVVALGVVGWGYWQWRQQLAAKQEQEQTEEESSTKRTGLPATDDPPETPPATTPGSSDKPAAAVPDDTRIVKRGALEVVDIGLSAPSLRQALEAQARVARSKNQRILLMTTGSECSPCRGLDRALEQPLMQQSLAGVRLVRVDLKAFKEELAELRMPTNLYPAFFLLGPDLTPLDGIHGGEWDEDIAENIAPVLGPFVRGEYRKRRHEWSPTTGGVAL